MIEALLDLATVGEPARQRMIVLVNASAGEILQRGGPAFAQQLTDLFRSAGVDADVNLVKGKHLAAKLRDLAAAHPTAQLVVAGGDGTISRLLPSLRLLRRTVGVLPLGTLNLLARDLGLGGTVHELVTGLTTATARPIDLGEVNGVPFHSNAGLGFLSRMAREREETRQRYPFSKAIGFAIAATRAMLLTKPVEVLMEVDGRMVQEVADAVLVTNNHFEGSPWTRPRLDQGLLEVHLLRAGGLRGRVAAAVSVWRGTWRELETLRSLTCRRVVINRRGKRSSTVAMDGEIRRFTHPLTFQSLPGALQVLAADTDRTDTDPTGA